MESNFFPLLKTCILETYEQEEEDEDISDRTTSTMKNAQIVGVLDMQAYSSCDVDH